MRPAVLKYGANMCQQVLAIDAPDHHQTFPRALEDVKTLSTDITGVYDKLTDYSGDLKVGSLPDNQETCWAWTTSDVLTLKSQPVSNTIW